MEDRVLMEGSPSFGLVHSYFFFRNSCCAVPMLGFSPRIPPLIHFHPTPPPTLLPALPPRARTAAYHLLPTGIRKRESKPFDLCTALSLPPLWSDSATRLFVHRSTRRYLPPSLPPSRSPSLPGMNSLETPVLSIVTMRMTPPDDPSLAMACEMAGRTRAREDCWRGEDTGMRGVGGAKTRAWRVSAGEGRRGRGRERTHLS